MYLSKLIDVFEWTTTTDIKRSPSLSTPPLEQVGHITKIIALWAHYDEGNLVHRLRNDSRITGQCNRYDAFKWAIKEGINKKGRVCVPLRSLGTRTSAVVADRDGGRTKR